MRIGLDFDNTIACYNDAFLFSAKKFNLIPKNWKGDKADIKNFLLKKNGGQTEWNRLQGYVYGKGINKAYLFPGLIFFFNRCKFLHHEIFIISHKTKHGHHDNEFIDLRLAAIDWMKSKKIFSKFNIDQKNIFFHETRLKKINRIKSLNLDYMVDDLEEVFYGKNLANTRKILFSKTYKKKCFDMIFSNWNDISNWILGELSRKEILYFSSNILKMKVIHSKKIIGKGNSSVFKLTNDQKQHFVLKLYPDRYTDTRNRLRHEKLAYKLFGTLDYSPNSLLMVQESFLHEHPSLV